MAADQTVFVLFVQGLDAAERREGLSRTEVLKVRTVQALPL